MNALYILAVSNIIDIKRKLGGFQEGRDLSGGWRPGEKGAGTRIQMKGVMGLWQDWKLRGQEPTGGGGPLFL